MPFFIVVRVPLFLVGFAGSFVGRFFPGGSCLATIRAAIVTAARVNASVWVLVVIASFYCFDVDNPPEFLVFQPFPLSELRQKLRNVPSPGVGAFDLVGEAFRPVACLLS